MSTMRFSRKSMTRSYSIEYIINDNEEDLYFGLFDKIRIGEISRKIIYLNLEKILGKNRVRNIQGIRIKNDELLKEVKNLNNIKKILIIIIIIIILINLGSMLEIINFK